MLFTAPKYKRKEKTVDVLILIFHRNINKKSYITMRFSNDAIMYLLKEFSMQFKWINIEISILK